MRLLAEAGALYSGAETSMQTPRTALGPGEIIAGHLIEHELGRGGMGVVYRATELALDRTVALKLITSQFSADPDFRARFWREARIAASLEHPSVLPIYKAGEEDGLLFISMRYVAGGDLASDLSTGRLEPVEAIALIAQVAEALDAAHARGLIHRDVKPSNILLERQGDDERAFLSDFGLAKVSNSNTGLTRTGELLGTVDYVAPEQIRGETLDPRSDVYSLGCVLYEALTGTVPFPQADELSRLWAHMHEAPPSILTVAPDLSDELDKTVRRALAKAPSERFASAGELASAATAAASAATAPARRVRLRRERGATGLQLGHKAVIVVAVGVVLVGLALAVLAVRDGHGTESAGGTSVEPAIPVPGQPDRVAVAGGYIWTLVEDGGRLTRIEPDQEKVESFPSPIDLGGGLFPDLGGSRTSLWLVHSNPTVGGIDRVAPTTVAALERVPFPSATSVAVTSTAVWVISSPSPGGGQREGLLALIDPATNGLVGSPKPIGRAPSDVAVGLDAVWVADRLRNEVVRASPRTLDVRARIRVGRGPTVLAITESAVWVGNVTDRTLTKIDPARNEAVGAPVALGKEINDLVFGGGSLWLAAGDGTVTELDARTGAAVAPPIRVARSPLSLAWDGDELWVASAPDQVVRALVPGQ